MCYFVEAVTSKLLKGYLCIRRVYTQPRGLKDEKGLYVAYKILTAVFGYVKLYILERHPHFLGSFC
jgi:hypothetical protein